MQNNNSKNKSEDYMDQFSRPDAIKKLNFATLFTTKPRVRADKSGRELVVNFDDRFPFVPNFVVRYSYYVRFLESKSIAGNHYHKKKQELLIPVVGSFVINLEDIKTKKRETVSIEKYHVIYIPTFIAHNVISSGPQSVLLVLASSPSTEGDEIPYKIE